MQKIKREFSILLGALALGPSGRSISLIPRSWRSGCRVVCIPPGNYDAKITKFISWINRIIANGIRPWQTLASLHFGYFFLKGKIGLGTGMAVRLAKAPAGLYAFIVETKRDSAKEGGRP
jgi:hypothetical protein